MLQNHRAIQGVGERGGGIGFRRPGAQPVGGAFSHWF